MESAKNMNVVAPLIAGISGGVVSTALLLPLDVVKVRLQVNEGTREQSTKGSRLGHRLGSFQVIRGIIRHEGSAGLYQGMTPALLGSAVSWGGYFFLYEGFKRHLRNYKSSLSDASPLLSPIENFWLACSAGGVMVFVTNPIWLIKLRMQLQMKKASQGLRSTQQSYSGLIDAARTIVKEEGIWALYKGTGPALLLTSHGGVQFVVYEYLRKHFHYQRAKRDIRADRPPLINRLEQSLGYLTIGAISKM